MSELGPFGDVCSDVKYDELVGWARISVLHIVGAILSASKFEGERKGKGRMRSLQNAR